VTRDIQDSLVAVSEALLERRRSDPIHNFEPHPKQRMFIDAVLSGEWDEVWMFAANRSGKSDAGAYIGGTFARFGLGGRPTSGWVSSLDFPTSRDVIEPKYFDNGFVSPGAIHPPFIPNREIEEWRVTDRILKLKNGSIIGFKSADSGRLKYQGAEKDWLHFDEEHPYDVYDEATIRVGAGKLHIFGSVTLLPPEGTVGGVSWMYPKIIKPWQDGERPRLKLFSASIYDNPHLPPDEIRRLEAKYPEDSVERRIRLNGEWLPGMAGARAYTGFNRLLNVRKQASYFNPRRPLCWIWDFNVEPMVSLIGQQDTSHGRQVFRVFRELVTDEGSIPGMVEWFREVHPQHLAEVWVYGDATGRHRTAQTQESSYTIIRNEMKTYPVPVKIKVPEVNPSISDRVNAVNLLCKDEMGEIRLEIDPSCKELIEDLEIVQRDVRNKIKKTTNRRDPYFRRTHTSDALGYWISYEAPVRPTRLWTRHQPKTIPLPSYGSG